MVAIWIHLVCNGACNGDDSVGVSETLELTRYLVSIRNNAMAEFLRDRYKCVLEAFIAFRRRFLLVTLEPQTSITPE